MVYRYEGPGDPAPGYCVAHVHNDYGVGFHNCLNKGRWVRGGKLYCGVHDPEAVRAREEKKVLKEQERIEARRPHYERAEAEENFIGAFPTDRLKALVDAGWTLEKVIGAAIQA